MAVNEPRTPPRRLDRQDRLEADSLALEVAEKRLAVVEGELLALREALEARQDIFDHDAHCMECAEPEEQCDEAMALDDRAASLHRAALTATPYAAALTRVVEAAVSWSEDDYSTADEIGVAVDVLLKLRKEAT